MFIDTSEGFYARCFCGFESRDREEFLEHDCTEDAEERFFRLLRLPSTRPG